MIDGNRKTEGLEMAKKFEGILIEAMGKMMAVAISYRNLDPEDVIAISKITVEHFAEAFSAAEAKTRALLAKQSNNQD